jgi:intein/homing endonuclease
VGNHISIEEFLKELQKKLKNEMPRIKREIKIYEEKLSAGKLTKNPTPSPQFNG